MRARILTGFMLRVYSAILGNALLSLLLQVPLSQASCAVMSKSNCNLDDRGSLNNTANWILYLVNECRSNAENPLIIAGDFSEEITTEIQRSTKTTLVLYTASRRNVDEAYSRARWSRHFYEEAFFRSQYKARIFLLGAKSRPLLNRLIKELKTSRWWNLFGLFLILDEEPNASCRNALTYLSTAWLNGILSAVYLCLGNDARNLTLYSFNPFENRVPIPDWIPVGSYATGRGGHPWTLFRNDLSGSAKNCDEIFSDKTRNLNGYPVRISAMSVPSKLDISMGTNISGEERYSGEDGWLIETLWGWLNATVVKVPESSEWGLGYTDDHDVDYGVKADVRNGRVDISMNQRYRSFHKNLESTYPHSYSSYCFLTKSRGALPLWKHMVRNINPLVTILNLVILLTLIPLLAIIEDTEYIGMLFNVLRIVVSVPLVHLPRKLSARFLVAGALVLFQIMNNGIFEGQITAALTIHKNYKEIDTLDELEASDYEIHGFIAFQNVSSRPQFKKRFVAFTDDEDCSEIVTEKSSIACANDCLVLLARMSTAKGVLHIAEEPILSDYVHFIAGIDWPILERFDQIIKRIMSAGLPGYWRSQTLWRMKIESVVAQSGAIISDGPRSIRFRDLDAIFYLLLTGLLFATVIFVVEVAFSR